MAGFFDKWKVLIWFHPPLKALEVEFLNFRTEEGMESDGVFGVKMNANEKPIIGFTQVEKIRVSYELDSIILEKEKLEPRTIIIPPGTGSERKENRRKFSAELLLGFAARFAGRASWESLLVKKPLIKIYGRTLNNMRNGSSPTYFWSPPFLPLIYESSYSVCGKKLSQLPLSLLFSSSSPKWRNLGLGNYVPPQGYVPVKDFQPSCTYWLE